MSFVKRLNSVPLLFVAKPFLSFSFVCHSLPGVKKPIDSYGPAGAVTNGDASDDDDDIDLFGSDDDEVDEEAERVRQERLAAYAAKKAKSSFENRFMLLSFDSIKTEQVHAKLCFSGRKVAKTDEMWRKLAENSDDLVYYRDRQFHRTIPCI